MAQYINKESLVKKIRKRLLPVVVPQGVSYDDWEHGADNERLNILALIDELEVKEVDIDIKKEVINFMASDEYQLGEESGCVIVAKHFFELGLKTQKGK